MRLVYQPRNINNAAIDPFVINNLVVNGTSTLTGAVSAGSTLSTAGLATLNSLTVTNNAAIGGTLGVTGISTLGVTNTGNLGVTGTLSTSGLATLNSLSVTNNASVGGTLGVTGISTLGVTNTGNLGVTGTLGVSGISTLGVVNSGNLSVTGTLSSSGLATLNSLSVTTTLGVTGVSTLPSIVTNTSLNVTGATIVGLTVYLTLNIPSLQSGATISRLASPVAGTIIKIWSDLAGASLLTGDATISTKISGSAVTNGTITITEAGSAVGDVDSCTPTAVNTVAEGSDISFAIGGGNTEFFATATLTIVILRSA